MKSKVIMGIVLTLLLTGTLTMAFYIQQAGAVEPPATDWTRTYGGAQDDEAYSVVETGDGGYVIAGFTESFGSMDFWLVKVDSSGNMQWNKTFGVAASGDHVSVVETGDGGYALAGTIYRFPSLDGWLVKVDSSGNHQWNKTYDGGLIDWAYSVVETGDGGYALAGHTTSFGAGAADFWLVKTDASGTMQWNKTYGGTGADDAFSLAKTIDGGYVIAGFTGSFGAGSNDFWLVRVDSAGNHEWNKTYGGSLDDRAFSVMRTGEGGYALAGWYKDPFGTGFYDLWLVKVNSSGVMEWNQTYGGAKSDAAYSGVKTIDGGYALAGLTTSFGAGLSDFYLVKTNPTGHIAWNKTYGGDYTDRAHSVVETSDGGYALAGSTNSFGAGGFDFWLVKVAGPAFPVGGIWIPVDKLNLIAPYIALVSTIILTVSISVAIIKYRKKQ